MSKKMYIIENNVNVLFALQNKLSLEGFAAEIDAGTSSIEAIIHKITMHLPDFIILDLILPGIDGFDLLATIKADKETFSIPVCIFTNLDDQGSKARSENLGAEYYFRKSELAIDDFVKKVTKIIENRERLDSGQLVSTPALALASS